MTNIVPLDKLEHGSLRVDLRAAAAYGDNQRFVQVMVNEFPQLAVHYPILFARERSTGELHCGAMLGFDEGENLFLGEWADRELYRPLALRRGPLHTHGQVVEIDLDHPRVGADGGQPLFNERGQPGKYLQGIIWAFQDLNAGIGTTKIFLARLTELELIEPADLEVRFPDGSMRTCTGLYGVSEVTLSRLPDATVVELFRRGYLTLIHLMIASLKQLPLMARKKHNRVLEATGSLAGARRMPSG
ncbi:MAG: SapC family protein [Steroidobacteraceae bacterium]